MVHRTSSGDRVSYSCQDLTHAVQKLASRRLGQQTASQSAKRRRSFYEDAEKALHELADDATADERRTLQQRLNTCEARLSDAEMNLRVASKELSEAEQHHKAIVIEKLGIPSGLFDFVEVTTDSRGNITACITGGNVPRTCGRISAKGVIQSNSDAFESIEDRLCAHSAAD